tara:strand:- start:17264 stop:18415 length:1152 start_codon:yes stop_codon:yes gene_type:complete
MKRLPLSEPYLRGKEIKYLEQCIKTNWLSGSGTYVNLFEKHIANFTSSKYSIGIINGTSALHLALKVLGCKPGNEIIVPTLTFVATVNAVIYNNCSPIFMDSDKYYNIDEEKTLNFLKKNTLFKNGKTINKKTKKVIFAIIVVHVWGNAAKFDKLLKYCKLRNIKVVEDASESLGTKYTNGSFKNLHTGAAGDIGCMSFNTNKIITCGSGGMVLTNNKIHYNKAFYLSTQAKNDPIFYIHNSTGYNYRLNNLNAAVGLAQFENFDKILKKKQKIHKIYKNKINKIPGLKIAEVPDYASNNCWLNVLSIDKNYKFSLTKLINKFSQNNIEVRPIWFLNHKQKMFKKYQTYKIENSVKQIKSSLCLPSSTSLSEASIERVVNLLK